MNNDPPPDMTVSMGFDVDIGSKEQLSVDQLTRSRLQFALGQNTAINQQTQFADAKAAALLAIAGLLALGLSDHLATASVWLLGGHYVLAFMTISGCLLALLPRISRLPDTSEQSAPVNRFSWVALVAENVGDTHADFLRTSQASQLVMAVANSNVSIARILRRKYRVLRLSVFTMFLDLSIIAIIVLGALSKS